MQIVYYGLCSGGENCIESFYDNQQSITYLKFYDLYAVHVMKEITSYVVFPF